MKGSTVAIVRGTVRCGRSPCVGRVSVRVYRSLYAPLHSQVCDADTTTDRQTVKRHTHNGPARSRAIKTGATQRGRLTRYAVCPQLCKDLSNGADGGDLQAAAAL